MSRSPFERLSDDLQRQLGWRRKEMTNLRIAVRASVADAQVTAIRAAVVLLYAHWEGFVKHAAKMYLEFVCAQSVTYRELIPNIVAFKISRALSEPAKKASFYEEVVQLLLNKPDEAATLPCASICSVQSNLNYEKLEEILYCLALDGSYYELKQQFIEAELLKTRHAIAHGEGYRISVEEYEDLHDAVLEMIQKFYELIYEAGASAAYKRQR